MGTNLPQYLKELEKAGSRKQPYVLILGDKLNPSQHFLIIERLVLPQSSTTAAIDACFKAFYILNFEYPVACKAVWHFLQHGCYELDSSGNNFSPLVRSLISFINK